MWKVMTKFDASRPLADLPAARLAAGDAARHGGPQTVERPDDAAPSTTRTPRPADGITAPEVADPRLAVPG